MQQLPPSEYIFPDPLEVDPEGEGLICIGADLSPSTLFEAYTHGSQQASPFAGGAPSHVASFARRIINPAKLSFGV